jgi:hypothetical protein
MECLVKNHRDGSNEKKEEKYKKILWMFVKIALESTQCVG